MTDLPDVDLTKIDFFPEGPLSQDEEALWHILSDRSGMDLAEFLLVDEERPDRCFRLRDYQWPWYRDASRYQIEQNGRDVGKALACSTPILTDNRGWVTMGEIAVGDVVFDETGTPCNVTRAYEVMQCRPCYQVKFSDGSSIVADMDHQWETLSRTHGRRVVTTEEIRLSLMFGPQTKIGMDGWRQQHNHRIEATSPIDCGEATDKPLTELTLGEAAECDWETRIAVIQRHMDEFGEVRSGGARVAVPYRHDLLPLLRMSGIVFRHRDDYIEWRPAGGINPFAGEKASQVIVSPDVPSRKIVAVEEVPSVPVRCIEVDSPNRLFLSGHDLIPTHNSMSIILRALAWPFCFPGQEMLLTAPRGVHLRPLTEKIEHQFFHGGSRLLQAVLQSQGKSSKPAGLSRQPSWGLQFANNARIITRLPNHDGTGVKGTHAVAIELDEGQDYPQEGFTEIIESLKTASEGSQWRIHGVASGRRDFFYKATTNEFSQLKFKVHKYQSMYRDTWGEDERAAKIDLYGGEDALDYRRNIYGHHGEARSALFSLAKLTACIAKTRNAWEVEYNRDVYKKIHLTEAETDRFAVADGGTGEALREYIMQSIPQSHLSNEYSSYYAGADIGMLKDPTEIVLWGQYTTAQNETKYRHLLRIKLVRVTTADQAIAVAAVFNAYGDRLRSFGLDRNGLGLGLVQILEADRSVSSLTKQQRRKIKGYTATQKVPVAFAEPEKDDSYATPAELVIRQDVTSWAFSTLRQLVDENLVQLPDDPEQTAEWQGQSVVTARDPNSGALVRRGGSRISLHTLDAAIMLVAAKDLPEIQAVLDYEPERPDVLLPLY